MFSKELFDGLGQAVERLEAQSSVEVVVVVAPQSGSYRELDHQNAFVAAMLLLLFAIHSPLEFAPDMLLFWLVLGYSVGLLVSSRWAGLRRLLTSPERRRMQVQAQARQTFVERRVMATRERSGLLVYLSAFERFGVFVPDLGVEAVLPRALLNDLEANWAKAKNLPDFEQAVLPGLETLIAPLAKALPRRDDDQNELPNEIVIEGVKR
jgi:putative membrane protein